MMRLISIAILALSSGCCTLISGTTRVVHFDSNPPGAKIFHLGKEVGTTPCYAELRRGFGDRQEVRVEPPDGGAPFTSSLVTRPTYLFDFNILNGVIIGSIIDMATGAVVDFEPLHWVDLSGRFVTSVDSVLAQ